MILIEIGYDIHNDKLVTIVKAFKILHYYLENYKYEVLVFMNHNNLHHFINMKNLGSRQVCWAQELFWYHF